jgi:hypothetical protein
MFETMNYRATTFPEVLRRASFEILEKIGSRSSNYFLKGGGLPSPSQVTDRTGRLLDAVMGGRGAIRKVEFQGDTAKITIGVSGAIVPYVTLQEKGGVRIVTAKMKRFFWHKFFEATIIGDPKREMWSALRFKNLIKFPPRPFLEPAVRDVAIEIPEILKRYTMEFLRMSITQTITERKK